MEIRKHKPTITLLSAIFLIVVGCGLLVAGFIVPPPGEIHDSVLVAFGMKYHYQYNTNNTKSHEEN